jgi:Protein of unknown function (DUF3304)
MADDKSFRWPRYVAAMFLAIATSACGQLAVQGAGSEATPRAVEPLGKPIGLAINGFNYTDLPIDFFSVAYQGGGNIFVSSPTSGGGGTVCCVSWRPGTALPKPILVEWSRYRNKQWRTCRKTVMLNGPVPLEPTAIGVHFMPDGDIQVELTEGEADPKVKLTRFDAGRRKETGNVIHDDETASCKDGR